MDQIDDPMTPPTNNKNGRSAAKAATLASTESTETETPTTDSATDEAAPAPLRPSFLSELAVAMRATAERERERIGGLVNDDATAHVEKVRARAAIETEELRRLAEQDVDHIEQWSASEIERVRAEADRKIGDRRSSLEEYLKQHDSIIDKEIEGVGAAVRDYNTTLDDFFARLAGADDPADIAARAEALPPPPDLDEVRSRARSSAVSMFAEPTPAAAVVESTDAAPATAADEVPVDTAPEAGYLIGDSAPEAGSVQGEIAAVDGAIDATPDGAERASGADPVPVMDPAATAAGTWPEAEPEPEPVAAAPAVDHTSAAVRLLRSVAPWTAPTHDSSEPPRSGSSADKP